MTTLIRGILTLVLILVFYTLLRALPGRIADVYSCMLYVPFHGHTALQIDDCVAPLCEYMIVVFLQHVHWTTCLPFWFSTWIQHANGY